MSRLEFANIFELLDESDASGVESGKKAQAALAEKKAAAAVALAPANPKPSADRAQTGKPQGQRDNRQDRTFSGERGPRSDRPPREDRPRSERPFKPRPQGDSPKLGGENTFTGEGQAAAAGAPRAHLPRNQRGGPRPDRGYERRAPGDQDHRPKREFDRRSGTGRGKEVAKGGAGKGGWGSLEDEAADGLEGAAETVAEGETKKEGEEVTVEAVPAETAAEATPEPDEPKTRTLEDYFAEKKTKSSALNALPTPRQAGEGDSNGTWDKYQAYEKKEENLFSVTEKGKKKETKDKDKEGSEKRVAADQVLKFQQERRERPERGERERRGNNAPRGTSRGPNNQGGQKRGTSAPNFGDSNAFPTLSTKA